MINAKLLMLIMLLSLVAGPAVAQCVYPDAVTMPNGSRATEAEMRAAKLAAEAYIATMEAYLKCLDAESTATAAAGSPDREGQRDAALRAMKKVADDYNAQLLAYKAASD